MESDSLNSGVATLSEPGSALDLASSAHLTPADFTVSDATRARILDSVAANTTTAYARCWRQFTDWCTERGRTPLPTTPQTLADYMTYMVDEVPRSIATCKQAIAAIRTQNRMAGHGRNAPDLELANAVLKSAGRQRAEDGEGGQRKAAPVIVRSLKRMIATCDTDSLLDVRDHALLTLGIAIFGRRSELSALQFGDLRANPDGISVLIRKSKTDQAGKGETISVVNGTFIDTNPVTAVERWRQRLSERGINDGRLFRAINVHGNPLPSMSGANINLAVQARARMAQLADLDEYSAHSLRAGAATIAYMNKTPISEICRMGRWSPKSSVVMGYIRAVDEWRNNPFRGVL